MKILCAASVFALTAATANCQVMGDLIEDNGILDHNSLDIDSLNAIIAVFDSTYHSNTPASVCRDLVEKAEQEAAAKNSASGSNGELSFDQQLEVDSIREGCMTQVRSNAESLLGKMHEINSFPTISLSELPLVIGYEKIFEGSDGKSYLDLEICGLPDKMAFEAGGADEGIEFKFPASDIALVGYKFNTSWVHSEDCSAAPGQASNWSPRSSIALSRQYGFGFRFSSVEKGAGFRKMLIDYPLSATVDCEVTGLKIAGGVWPVCTVKRVHITDSSGKVFLTLEGRDRSWTGSVSFSEYLQ